MDKRETLKQMDIVQQELFATTIDAPVENNPLQCVLWQVRKRWKSQIM